MCLTAHGWDTIEFFKNPPYTPAWPMIAASPALRMITNALVGSLPREFRRIGGMEQSRLVGQSSRVIVGTALNVLRLPPLKPSYMLISPEGYGVMRQALNADPALPLADAELRNDLHLTVRGAGPGCCDLPSLRRAADQAGRAAVHG